MSAHTPGPWRWEVNLKSRQMSLVGGRPQFDLTVMDFQRWGMSGAKARLLVQPATFSFMVMRDAEAFAVPIAGREHHAEWCQTLNHPDAKLMEAAPDLLDACKALRATCPCDPDINPQWYAAWESMLAAIAKAEARS